MSRTFGFVTRGINSYSEAKIEKNVHNLTIIMSYPSARRTGRALSALALAYLRGGSMGVHLSQEVEFTNVISAVRINEVV